ncbi:MAG: DUF4494 domain-containing protein [Lachnospiraceae bacterium]|nr:DUF4494 domain-containing protein [Lachnospiraceae bacterium]
MALYIETKVRYDKTQENGSIKKVNEPYLVDALSFTEAEARIIEEMTPFISGDFTVSAVKKTKISEIFRGEGDRWYMVKVNYLNLNEKTGAIKKTASYILVQAFTFRDALNKFDEGMKGTVADYEIAALSDTEIMDVYPAKLSPKSTEDNPE